MCAHSSSSSRNPFDSFWLPLIYALISHLERGAIVCARPSCWAEWRHDRRERKKPVALGPKHKWISRVIKDARLLFSCNYIVGYRFYIHTTSFPLFHLLTLLSLYFYRFLILFSQTAQIAAPAGVGVLAWESPGCVMSPAIRLDLAMSNGWASAAVKYNTFTSCLIYRVISTSTEFLIAPSLHERAYIYLYLYT